MRLYAVSHGPASAQQFRFQLLPTCGTGFDGKQNLRARNDIIGIPLYSMFTASRLYLDEICDVQRKLLTERARIELPADAGSRPGALSNRL